MGIFSAMQPEEDEICVCAQDVCKDYFLMNFNVVELLPVVMRTK